MVAGLMLLVSAFVTVLMAQSQATFDLGSAHIALDQKGREAIRRISPYLRSAFSPQPGGGGAVLEPPGAGAAGDNVTLSTTEDWLADSYPSVNTSATVLNAQPGVPLAYFLYRVRFTGADLVLEKLNGPAPYVVQKSVPLVRGAGEARLSSTVFTRLADDSSVIQVDLNLTTTTRSVGRQQRLVEVALRATVNVAAESLRG